MGEVGWGAISVIPINNNDIEEYLSKSPILIVGKRWVHILAGSWKA